MLEAESVIGEFLGIRLHRFPRLAGRLLERFAAGDLSPAATIALRRATVDAIRQRAVRIATRPGPSTGRESEAHALAMQTWRAEQTARINAGVDENLALIRKADGRREYNARCSRTHVILLENWRAEHLAAVVA